MKPDQLVLENWAEILMASLIIVGFIVAVAVPTPFISYVVIFLSGLLGGRIIYEKWLTQPIFPFLLITVGFFLGFMLGSFSASRLIITIIFFAGIIVSYLAHKKGYVSFFVSGRFLR